MIRELYSEYRIEGVSRKTTLAGNGDNNQLFAEVIIRLLPRLAWFFLAVSMLLQDQVFPCPAMLVWYVFQQFVQGAV